MDGCLHANSDLIGRLIHNLLCFKTFIFSTVVTKDAPFFHLLALYLTLKCMFAHTALSKKTIYISPIKTITVHASPELLHYRSWHGISFYPVDQELVLSFTLSRFLQFCFKMKTLIVTNSHRSPLFIYLFMQLFIYYLFIQFFIPLYIYLFIYTTYFLSHPPFLRTREVRSWAC